MFRWVRWGSSRSAKVRQGSQRISKSLQVSLRVSRVLQGLRGTEKDLKNTNMFYKILSASGSFHWVHKCSFYYEVLSSPQGSTRFHWNSIAIQHGSTGMDWVSWSFIVFKKVSLDFTTNNEIPKSVTWLWKGLEGSSRFQIVDFMELRQGSTRFCRVLTGSPRLCQGSEKFQYELALHNSTRFSKGLKYASTVHKNPEMFWKYQESSKVLHQKNTPKVFLKKSYVTSPQF